MHVASSNFQIDYTGKHMNEQQYDSQLFAELYDVQPQAIIWSSPVWSRDGASIIDFEFIYCNEEGLKYLNITRAQQQGMRVTTSSSLSKELQQSVLHEMIQVYQTGEKLVSNIYNSAINKHARVLRTKLRNGVLTVVQDRTQEYRIIQQLESQAMQLQEQKALLDKLLEHSPAGISITEVIRNEAGNIIDGRTTLGNELSFEYTGIPRHMMEGKTISEVDPGLLESPLYQMALNTLKTGIPFHTQYYFEPTGRWLELSVAKMDDTHLINVFMDVTSTKEAQIRQQKLLDELQRSNANLEEFAYAASHDLQEPLRKIYTFSDRLKHDLGQQLSSSQQMIFNRIESATQRMRSLIDDLLSYSQVSAKPDAYKTVSLTEVVQQVLTDLEALIGDTGATVNVSKLPKLKGDERQLRQMFQNLIGNAIKYHKKEEPPVVDITCRKVERSDAAFANLPEGKKEAYYLIEIKDNGIGFEQAYAEKIFQVFQRLHGRNEYEGTGVGLAIVQKVISNHKGYISANSSPGNGATFSVLLPV